MDYESAGLNKMVLFDTVGTNSPYARADYVMSTCWLERDDLGYIRRITSGDRVYDLTVDGRGVCTAVTSTLMLVQNDAAWTFRNQPRIVEPLANDRRWEGGPLALAGLGAPGHGTLVSNANGSVIYQPAAGYVGTDTFTYVATAGFGIARTGTVTVTVLTNALTTGMRLWYRFDETNGTTAADASGNGRTGTLVSGPTWTNGRLSGALWFDGTNDYVSVPVGAVTGLGSQVTIAFWAFGNPDQMPVNNAVLNANDGSGYRTLNLHLPWSDGTVYWDAGNSGGSSYDRVTFAASTNGEGRWSHWAFTKNASSGQMAIYLNGQLRASGAGLTRTFPAAISGFRIGSYAAGGTCFPGAVDDLRIYPAALDGGAVRAIYEGAEALSPPAFTPDPVLEADAMELIPYSSSLADNVVDTNAGEVLSFAKVSGPAWLAVAADGSLSGTPAFADVGTNTFTVRVTDSAGFVDEAPLRIKVNVFSGNHPPAFSSDPLLYPAATEDAPYAPPSLAGAATDVDAGETLAFSKISGPAWLTVAANGALTGTPLQADVGTNVFTVRVTDSGALYDDAALRIVVANVNDAPAWSANPLDLAVAGIGMPYAGTLAGSASDEDAGDTVTFAKTAGPVWLAVGSNGALSGTPAAGDLGTNLFTVRAQDLAGAYSDVVARVAVVGLAPAITSQPQSAALYVGQTNVFAVGAAGSPALTFQWLFNTNTVLAGQTNATLVLAGVTTNQAGAYRALVSNAYGVAYSTNATLTVAAALTIGEAVDAPELVWTNGGTGVWTGQTTTVHDGVDAAESAQIGFNSRSNWIQTTVSGPGTLKFWWRVSSETNWDYLTFLVDGTSNRGISGEAAWQQASNRVAAGAHALRWRYGKDTSLSNGQDRGWVDQVSYVPDAPVITAQPADATLCAGGTALLAVASTGIDPRTHQWFSGTNALAGATNAQLVFAPADAAQSGSYFVLVSNSAGVATSRTALLLVTNPPPLIALTQPTNGAHVVVTAAVAFAATVTSNGQAMAAVQFRSGTKVLGASAAGTLMWTNATPGSHLLTARAIFAGGAGEVTSAPVVIEVLTLADGWREEQFAAAATNESTAGWSADPDGDGLPNLGEYGFGTDPTVSNAWPRMECIPDPADGTARPLFRYHRRVDPCDVRFVEELSDDALTWSTGATEQVSLTPDTNAVTADVRVRAAGPGDAAPRFFRLRLTP